MNNVDNLDLSEVIDNARLLLSQGNSEAALKLYSKLYAQNTESTVIAILYAEALVTQRNSYAALDLLGKINAQDFPPETKSNFYTTKAKALVSIGKLFSALDLFITTVEIDPHSPNAWSNLGCCLMDMGRDCEATAHFEKAVQLNPFHTEASRALAQLYKKVGNYKKSKLCLENILTNINDTAARIELVNILLLLNQHIEAREHAKYLCINGTDKIEHMMLLARTHFLSNDINAYIKCLNDMPNQLWKGVSTQSLVIGTLAESGQPREARKKLKVYLSHNPVDANARLVRARDLLSHGEFEDGWRDYAFRLNLPANQVHFGLESNWDGHSIKNQNVLILGEQGIGDIAYFSRFIIPLLQDNTFCSLICEPRIESLLAKSFNKLNVFSDPALISLLPRPLVRVPLGSLPLLYGKNSAQVRSCSQSLRASPEDIAHMSEIFLRDASSPLRIGISLSAGRPSDEYQKQKRSLPSLDVLNILAGRNLSLVDLQHNGHDQSFYDSAKKLGIQVLRYPQLTENLGLLLAALSCLDGVVTAQQTNAHLCGALARKCITILPVCSHFVYGPTTHSYWYPKMQIIRSKAWGDWSCIKNKLSDELDIMLL